MSINDEFHADMAHLSRLAETILAKPDGATLPNDSIYVQLIAELDRDTRDAIFAPQHHTL